MAAPLYTTVENVLATVPTMGSVTTISSAVVFTLFLMPTEARINAKLSKLYSVPVQGNPPLLEHVAREITCYLIMTRRLFPTEQKPSSSWPDRFKEAIAMLDDIADGNLPLLTGSGTAVPTLSDGAAVTWSSTMDYQPTFRDNADEWSSTIDSLKLDSINADHT